MNASARILAVATAALALSTHATITFFDASLDGAQEVPPVATAAEGECIVAYDTVTSTLWWNVSFTGITNPVTGMHFHGPAGPGTNAGVQVNIGGISGLASPSIGSTAITPALASELLSGLWYVNIHSSVFPAGEIRGQVINRGAANVVLSGAEEVPPVSTPAYGAALVDFDATNGVVSWYIVYEDLSAPVTGMHFHGPAGPGTNAAVQVNIGGISGFAVPQWGTNGLSVPQSADLLSDLWYLNVHSTNFPGGEIRGQIVGIPEGCTGVALAFCVLGVLHRAAARRRAV